MKELLENFLTVIDRSGGDSRQLIFEKPATEKDLFYTESIIGKSIPNDFRNKLLTLSSSCDFKWFLPNDFDLPYQLKEIFCGVLNWNLETIIRLNTNYDINIAETFSNRED